MVAKNKAAAGKGVVKKLKLKKETLKDLVVSRSNRIKGGAASAGAICGPRLERPAFVRLR